MWRHPCDEYYKKLYEEEKNKKLHICRAHLSDKKAKAVPVEGFTPCGSFKGARPGKVFKRGVAGVGYYDELPAPTHIVPS